MTLKLCILISKYVKFLTEKQIDLKSVDLKKLKVRDLKKILNDWDETCDGCLEKGDFIKRIEELKPKHLREELWETQKRKKKKLVTLQNFETFTSLWTSVILRSPMNITNHTTQQNDFRALFLKWVVDSFNYTKWC